MREAALARSYVPDIAQVSTTLLGELREAHCRLIEQIANMEAVTSATECHLGDLVNGRWKISQASLERRMLSARICDYLLPRIDPAQGAELKRLQEADRGMLRKSASHVGDWTAQKAQLDWHGYCRASREMRRHMHDFIALEQQLLYAILERATRLGL